MEIPVCRVVGTATVLGDGTAERPATDGEVDMVLTFLMGLW